MATDFRDPRRAGFVASALGAAYVACLFIPESLTFRLAFASVVFVLGAAFAMFVPLPRWKESDDRKRLAAKLMVGEMVTIMVLATLVRWWTA
ncbi:MAG TPA: hypothetical protein VGV93_01120 [Acidimicrobiales bacterium]|nr:hypothetical protein [Acidimicrobiales bacterium]